jgi:AcrR family transcriptional regulator
MSDSGPRMYSGRPVEEWKAARRERLLAAAFDLFGTVGYRTTSIERLCSQAKVSTRHFYQEFANKEAVLLAVYAQVIELGIARTGEALAAAPPSPIGVRLTGAVGAYLDSVMSDVRRAQISFVEVLGVSTAVEERRLGFREGILALIKYEGEAAVARGEIDDRDFRFGGMALVGAVNTVVYDWIRQPDRPPAEQVQEPLVELAITLLTEPHPARER